MPDNKHKNTYAPTYTNIAYPAWLTLVIHEIYDLSLDIRILWRPCAVKRLGTGNDSNTLKVIRMGLSERLENTTRS